MLTKHNFVVGKGFILFILHSTQFSVEILEQKTKQNQCNIWKMGLKDLLASRSPAPNQQYNKIIRAGANGWSGSIGSLCSDFKHQ